MRSLLLLYFSAALALHVSRASAGQIPVVGGLLGGVPRTVADPVRFRKADKVLAAAVTGNVTTTPGKLRVVQNSGICETTTGVNQASGYADLRANESIWFWYFEARNNPSTAPLALWFNGGPGSSSMIGLFQEHGPCRITNDSRAVTLNPFSWNNNANMLYIDQPVGTGFSHGNLNVGTSQEAAADMWTFMQIFLSDSRFASLRNNSLAIWTESYGGHFGPAFAAYFLSQNQAIASKNITGIPLNLQVLGIGDGLTDPLSQYPGYITYAGSNGYHPLVNGTTIARANASWFADNGCKDQITDCNNGGSNPRCMGAVHFCNSEILNPLSGNFDVYYVPTEDPDPYPPPLDKYLATIQSTIGAEVTWEESNMNVYDNFIDTGDWMRNSRPDLETVINAGVRTIVYDGDADYICNFNGVEAMVNNLNMQYTSLLQKQSFQTYTVAGQAAGLFKNAGTFSYIRIFGAGHEVPAYKFGNLAVGQVASQMFDQIMANQSLHTNAASGRRAVLPSGYVLGALFFTFLHFISPLAVPIY